MRMQAQHGSLLQAVLVTVCVEPELAARIGDAMSRLPWVLDISHLDSFSSATRRPAFGPQMRAANAGFVFIDYTQNVDQAIGCTQYLVQTFGSKLVVVAIAEEDNPDLILQAMRAGCNEFLPYPVTSAALAEAISRLSQRWSSDMRQGAKEGSVLALLGAKGGVGTTTLAVHLALYLSQKQGKRVLLVDSQPELGHVCIYLGLDGTRFTFGEVVRNVNRLDSDLLQGFVAKLPNGLAVLSSPDLSLQSSALHPNAVAKTLDFLRSEYDYVVIDCDRAFGDVTRMVIEAATRIYLVSTPEVCAIRDLSRHIDRILHSTDAMERLNIVVNRFSSQAGLSLAKIEAALKLPVNIKVPNNYLAFTQAGNAGKPVPPESKLDVAQEMNRWANSLTQVQQPPAVEKSRTAGAPWSFWGRNTITGGRKEASV